MADPAGKTKAPQLSVKELRERRLADVLRANLKRRKAAAKGAGDADESSEAANQDGQTQE
ncbi:hypothetical protein DLM45_10700 [Hyphomicrobium methylovorum]|uniref:hypothetical protein n=1 Tax=Hyphomicrobium methylovorum TaxID=84 RepID=UPI0015E7C31F|nr:hypothetical protein [Hyphomicrobium methylovorum]MBA2126681.1 hypothetical protein [Hyphomicrobium methylovorum]